MASLRLRAALTALTALVCMAGAVQADPDPVTQPVSYKGASYVQITLGQQDQEQGIHLVADRPDGVTTPLTETLGRQSEANSAGTDRFFYFDVADSYVRGGQNLIGMTVTYYDLGFGPAYLEYDSYDRLRPEAKVDAVVKKRIPLFTRTNSEAWKTEYIVLEDARFANSQPGGADFRIGSSDDLVLRNISVRVSEHHEPEPPIRVVLNGQPVLFDPNDVQPFVHPQTSRTLVPVRAMFNALGVTDITWNNELRRVEARKGQTTIMLTVDSEWATVNGKQVKLDQPAVILADRTLIPLRFVTEQFGLTPSWDGAQRLITLQAVPAPPAQQNPSAPQVPQPPQTTQPKP